ncbi:hypothetical protein [uncultured Desulfovibrio sp.]|uniref:hypothetical protein n=1 Tax=uncultured Desulfovibrio sp. TaxID=167968 RepID=UPI0026054355|nr:hypothetical protein [uncultured Desulfovibrio sp.]
MVSFHLENFAEENICLTDIFLRFRCLAPAVATQEATDGDSNWLPRQPVNGTAVAIRTQAEPANGERHFPTKRDKWRKSVVFPPYYSARASAPAAAREFHNFIAKTLSSKTPPRLIRKGRRAYHGGLSGMKCA